MPSLDVLAGKQIDWDVFASNPEFYQKNFDLKYNRDGVIIKRRKGNQNVNHRRDHHEHQGPPPFIDQVP